MRQHGLAIGGSSINRWADERDLGARLMDAAASVSRANLARTHVLVVQGEADEHPAPAYARLRPSEFTRSATDAVQSAMRPAAYVAHLESVVALLEPAAYLADFCHLSEHGLDQVADARAAILLTGD